VFALLCESVEAQFLPTLLFVGWGSLGLKANELDDCCDVWVSGLNSSRRCTSAAVWQKSENLKRKALVAGAGVGVGLQNCHYNEIQLWGKFLHDVMLCLDSGVALLCNVVRLDYLREGMSWVSWDCCMVNDCYPFCASGSRMQWNDLRVKDWSLCDWLVEFVWTLVCRTKVITDNQS
jgi:hypothetical protein